jgi:hypothetical protein
LSKNGIDQPTVLEASRRVTSFLAAAALDHAVVGM